MKYKPSQCVFSGNKGKFGKSSRCGKHSATRALLRKCFFHGGSSTKAAWWLTIAGAPVGRELGRYYLREELQQGDDATDQGNGSVMVVVATDAPADAWNLKRMAARAMLGLGRTDAAGSNGSGDYVIAFSTAPQVRIRTADKAASLRRIEVLPNDAMSPLFLAVVEATEEAVYNSLLRATTVTGRGHTVQALPIEKTTEILRKYGDIK
jgi:D-aminopeptidase